MSMVYGMEVRGDGRVLVGAVAQGGLPEMDSLINFTKKHFNSLTAQFKVKESASVASFLSRKMPYMKLAAMEGSNWGEGLPTLP